MNMLTQILTAFCASAILIGALYIICPNGICSKSVKYVLSLCFLLLVISATSINIKKADFSFDFSNSSEINSQELDICSAKYVYSALLQKAGINFKEIVVCTNKDNSNSIVINKVIIYSNCEKEKIMAALGDVAVNFEVEIINE